MYCPFYTDRLNFSPQVRPHWSGGDEGRRHHGHRFLHVDRRCVRNPATCDRGSTDYFGFIYGLLGESCLSDSTVFAVYLFIFLTVLPSTIFINLSYCLFIHCLSLFSFSHILSIYCTVFRYISFSPFPYTILHLFVYLSFALSFHPLYLSSYLSLSLSVHCIYSYLSHHMSPPLSMFQTLSSGSVELVLHSKCSCGFKWYYINTRS